ncbi:endonuclease [Noviherbaspirillum cavernae]|uniref:Endonuclease n=1 Tax=Noviherbaspirillum cavernae TaxID=2320862 RepID=A0A418X0G9_9BURK|nr:endonuclease/exonuclease/phosphatase family protein [Noviherbaspirillum cavernae]RJG05980.1 endonuclease [Noviherbaspirillum cavernae]
MKLLTWNIQWGRGADGRVDLGRVVAHAKRFADIDVFCLQEVASGYPELPGNNERNQFDELAQRLPGFHAIVGIASDVPGHPVRRAFGNMMLSRYPMLQIFRHLLPWPAEPGVFSMQRVAVEATLDTPAGYVRVTTTHLEYYSVEQRFAQIERLRELHREAASHARSDPPRNLSDAPFFNPPRGGPAILTGDLNCLPDADERKRLLAPIDAATPRYHDAWERVHGSAPRTPTVGVYDKMQWPGDPFVFDYILVSEDLCGCVKDVVVDSETDASDHQPMLLVLA